MPPDPYQITHNELSLSIAIVEMKTLLLHEETIPQLLEKLTSAIRKDRCLHHPIIVDEKSLVVLDGVHRVVALQKLRYKRILASLVDYKNPAIKILNWCRTITETNTSQNVLSTVKRIVGAGFVEEVSQIKHNQIGTAPVAAALETATQRFIVKQSFDSLRQAYDIVKRVEEGLKKAGFRINYETSPDALQKLRKGQVDAVLHTPRLSKKAVVESARSGQVFSFKASRHIIPARPLNVCVPLKFLKTNKPLKELNENLVSMLRKKRVRHLPLGSLFEGRRYEEDVYVFEE